MTGLRRFVTPGTGRGVATAPGGARAAPPGPLCELCGEGLGRDHRHAVDVEHRALLCVCRACGLLLDRPVSAADGAGRYRTVSDRHRRVAPMVAGDAWAALGIPVGMAFVLRNARQGRIVACYPSPAGATEADLEPEDWERLVADNPALAEVEPDVEAALFRTGPGEPECYVVPIDRCYELVGELRRHWHGFDGGGEVRQRIDEFFADLRRRTAN